MVQTPADARRPAPPAGPHPLRVRPRAVVLGLALTPLLCAWAMRTEIISGGSELIEASLLPLVVFALFLLSLGNAALRRRRPAAALTRAELLLVYVMQTVSVGIAGLGEVQFLNQALAGQSHYATPNNHWADWQRFVPAWWVPDPSVLPAYYHGGSTLWTAAHLRGWAVPIGVWSGFIFTLAFSFLCLNTLLRRAWVEEERLPFPLVALPLALTEEEATRGLLRQPLFWAAAGLTACYRSVSGLHRLFPTFPDIPGVGFKGQLLDPTGGAALPTPWSALGFFRLALHPMIVGITYFVPQDVSLSVWFFYLVSKGENVAAAAFGLRAPGAGEAANVPYTGEQGAGAFLGLALLSLWGARRHLGRVWRKAVGSAPDVADGDEALSYRTSVWGLAASFALLVGFMAAGGLAWHLGAAFFALYGLMIIAATRLRAEAGPMLGYGPDLNPHGILVQLPGGRAWGAQDLTALTYLQWMDTDYRTVAMPPQMEALKIMEALRVGDTGAARAWGRWMLAATALATVASFLSVLTIYYHYGAATGQGDNPWRAYNGQSPYVQLEHWLTAPEPADPVRGEWLLGGLAVTLLLSRLRTLFVWWPLHPAGFALAQAGFGIHWVWFPTFLGWAAKAVLLRYGGVQTFRRGIPFFMGLILGDIVTACVWSLLGVLLDTQMYMFFPG